MPAVRTVLALLFSLPLLATTYYVAPTGNDSNPGTSASPFLTIQQAANVVNPGDTVLVENGTYSSASCLGANSNLVNMNRGGSSGSPVVFQSQNIGGAVLDGGMTVGKNDTNTCGGGIDLGANYVTIKGFEIRNFNELAITDFHGGTNYDIIQNNIHDIGRFCTDSTTGRDALFLDSSGGVVERNSIHDIGRYGPGENGCSPSTAYWQNHDHGTYIDGATNLTIKNNLYWNCLHGWSIQFYGSTATANINIFDNVFAFPNPNRTGAFTLSENLTNVAIENNIFYQPSGSVAFFFDSYPFSGVTIRYNLVYSGTSGSAPSGVTMSNELDNTNPLFTNPASDIFTLQSGSPAVDRGLTISSVTNDYAGTSRPQGCCYDIGAYESTTSGTTPVISSFTANPTTITSGKK